jgi:hypothetical protein
MALTPSLQSWCIETAQALPGSARRLFMARTVNALGPGGPRPAARDLGWSRMTMRHGPHELTRGLTGLDAGAARGRQRAEAQRPSLLSDRNAMVERHSPADPQVRTPRRETRLTAAAVRRHLLPHHG